MKLSETIKLFLDSTRELEDKNQIFYEGLKRQEGVTQDILHKLELEKLTCYENMQLAERLAESRKERRYYKDKLELTECVVGYIATHQKAMNELSKLLGEVRKIEKYQESRSYNLRVLEN